MITALAVALLLQAQSQAPAITHERIGEGRYRLRIVAPGISEVEQAQRLLVPEALRLCGSLPPAFGRYRWEGLERLESPGVGRAPESLTLDQEIVCGGVIAPPPAPAETAATPDPDWQPTPAAEEAVRAATITYFAAKDGGRYAEAYAMLSPGNQATSPFASWSEQARDFNGRAGAVRDRRLIRVTWYNNPPSAPVAGIYAAVDFNRDFANLHFLCGYVVWLLQPDGSWRLVREEQGMAARAGAPNATPEEIARLRPQVGCRD